MTSLLDERLEAWGQRQARPPEPLGPGVERAFLAEVRRVRLERLAIKAACISVAVAALIILTVMLMPRRAPSPTQSQPEPEPTRTRAIDR